MTVAERFWEKVGPDECWPWKVCRKKYRYPTFRYNGKNHKAQRIAYLLQHGQIDWKLSVLHRCDNTMASIYSKDLNTRTCTICFRKVATVNTVGINHD